MPEGTPHYHVAHLIPTAADGGVRRYLQQCSRMDGVRTSAISLFATDEPSDMALACQSEIRLDIPLSRHRETEMIESRLAQAVGRLRPDLIHSHHFGCDIFCGAAMAQVGARQFIRHVHGVMQRSSEHPTDSKSVRRSWTGDEIAQELRVEHLVHRTLCVSRDLRQKLSGYGIPEEKLEVLPNAIDTALFRPSDELGRRKARSAFGLADDAYAIGFLGRIEPCKNPAYLVRLALEQQESKPRPIYVIAGSGPLETELRREVQAAGVGPAFSFLPPRTDVLDFYAALDALIIPSYSEGSPFVLLEAMACGIAVMASRVGGISEIVRDDVDGLLIDPDDIGSGVAAVEHLADPAGRRSLGRQGRKRVASAFEIFPHQRRLRDIYLDALSAAAHA